VAGALLNPVRFEPTAAFQIYVSDKVGETQRRLEKMRSEMIAAIRSEGR
jgi:hypothetical protein